MPSTNTLILILALAFLVGILIVLILWYSFHGEEHIIKTITVSNRDWLESLSNHDLTTLILGGLADFSARSTQSQNFLENWLDEEYNEELMKIYFPYLDCFRGKSVNIF